MEPIDQEIYARAVESKHHYDNLSWLIGGVALIFFAAVINKIDDIPAGCLSKRIVLLVAGILVLLAWYFIYDRNRFWGEVANETLKDIERKNETAGLGIRFMKASVKRDTNSSSTTARRWPFLRYLELRNTDEKGNQWAPDGLASCYAISMHRVIAFTVLVLSVLAVIYVVVP